ncbi:4Fe-4S dicluster domain-containing protein [Candidatus Poribacteria bacterium]|nr:4Fe-4S dicluster domain-containing protein [Candidatus Poribacteria bacterium]
MSIKKVKTFKGGHNFGNLLGSPENEVRELELPNKVFIPLKYNHIREVPAIVEVGDKVKTGQIIGIDDKNESSPVHASISGYVTDICPVNLSGEEAKAVVIESDGKDDWTSSYESKSNFESISKEELNRILYFSGSGFPARVNEMDNLIIRAVYTQPYCLNNEIIIGKDIDNFVTGLCILKKALNPKTKIHIGIDNRDENLIKILYKSLDWLEIHPLKPKYPQDHPVILKKTLLDESFSSSSTVIIDTQSVIHAYYSVVEGKPVVGKIIVLGGHGITERGFVKIRIGTPLICILSNKNIKDKRCIVGGIITGKECNDLSIPVTRDIDSLSILKENHNREFLSFIRPGVRRDSFSTSFLSSIFPKIKKRFDTNEKGEHRPCIYCNYCEEACPVELMPYLLNNYVTHDMLDEAREMGLMTCIDCGLCTYVCPCKIPLMENIQSGKEIINENNQENS